MFKLIFYGKKPQYPYINEVIITIFFVQSKFQIIPEIDTISIIVEYYNIKCSSVWYYFDPITVYYKGENYQQPQF